jgi:D-3-phosphoglycerate dehydrogenase
VDNIDVDAAKKKGIVISNVPDYCIEEVSDTAIAHMLNCLRKVSLANNFLHKLTVFSLNRKFFYNLKGKERKKSRYQISIAPS